MDRRTFIGAAMPLVIGLPRALGSVTRPVRFGVIADLHHGLAPDALWRLEAFVEAANARELDFVIQLGDFCYAKRSSAECVRMFDRIELPRYHVLGNHDMDVGSKADVMGVWGMPKRYYSFDVGGYHFVVLDLNSLNIDGQRVAYDDSNFYVDQPGQRAWADPEQLAWLKADLDRSEAPTIVFSHQPLGFEYDGVIPPSQLEIFDVLRAHDQVAACLCGHMHVDRYQAYEDMACVCFNSASYFWAKGMRAYEDPLYAFVTLDGASMSIEGVTSRLAKGEDRARAADWAHVKGFAAKISDREVGLRSE